MTSLARKLSSAHHSLRSGAIRPLHGRITRLSGPIIRAVVPNAVKGQICEIPRRKKGPPLSGRIVALNDLEVIISLFGRSDGLSLGLPVRALGKELTVPVGEQLLGRVVDGLGRPIDGLPPLPDGMPQQPIYAEAPPPMSRPLIEEALTTGLKAIDFATTLGRGQRIGIFGSAGTGKTSTLSAIAQHCDADVIVIGMIGERGREIREFLEHDLPFEKRGKTVVVAATSDRPPMERLNAAHITTAISEGFRDQGKSVLMMMDSLTRVARSLREIGLAAGEAPTRRGYPASVYPALPELIERTGRTERGDITGVFTVLVEGDDASDPIAEEVRSLTDGHILLDPKIAAQGRYPAINISRSLSRIMNRVTDIKHQEMLSDVRKLFSAYERIEILLQIGEYERGQDDDSDRAVELVPKLIEVFRQGVDEAFSIEETCKILAEILDHG